ncbi:BON domain-containing protein [Advenella sp. WQ 585]|uniref:BON domain-containing protein n=1 Tax=Advenella mandrilli TaxID=2800330 RepID=A0ABS1EF10_9BURK|nr:BON domain-containing protein [Advenella mandrilli]MBK1781893.1 BON domain-containing protein [Advenella mandrilli]
MKLKRAARIIRPTALLALVLGSSTLLSACVPLLVGGAATTTAVVATDRRTSGMQLTDKNIGIRTESRIGEALKDTVRINAMAYNQRVLLTGEATTIAAKEQAAAIAKGVPDVKTVLNEVVVAPPAAFSTRANDSWITSKVRTELLTTKNVPSSTIDITTSRGVVYLMGQVSPIEGDRAASAAAGVSGVNRVVKVFDLVSGSGTASNSSVTSSSGSMTVPGTEVNPSSTQTYPLN